jgi:hypothetical protein
MSAISGFPTLGLVLKVTDTFYPLAGVILLMILSADDLFFPATLRDKSEAKLESRKGKDNFVEYEFRVYKGCPICCFAEEVLIETNFVST